MLCDSGHSSGHPIYVVLPSSTDRVAYPWGTTFVAISFGYPYIDLQ